ncbi:16S rRNA (cytidine(1402)-2'-O)-methyltransferase [Nesterenkonia sp. E16_7]|uniref:16S rRNA (cytidine(1402)-2'-O)-methyltransferase n=1 Tax=unclassified Nesterenkonia TaxID=2629769 RepID=UPI001A93A664|nr:MULTISPECIES: 16S rRNA (cytidine(1402)-2'-O)-methyltransferase [unclassified Nesterenkonia]MBO0596563.1 16S rRNA (cytidine(1402)-2'-O)-methyltransferase [Nesterenkonia sp. E16_10]MBO0597234.1 16S rRNA (cytidine(1402)-2'-O)-methyltransferase [Nesterenkonia sp. E16_7]
MESGEAEQPQHTREPDDSGLWDTPIVLAATPIGNLGDATDRLKRLLATAEVIAAEDTRTARHLARALQVRFQARVVSLHEHNEAARSEELVEQARQGTRVLVVSDAGMPSVSDPGFRLVETAIAAGVGVTVAPGASAVTTALALSGLPTDRFTFAGFVPRKAGERKKLLDRLAAEEWTTVLFESPHRIAATLREFAASLGEDRPAALARELTKRYEEVLRGGLGELAGLAAERHLRGEMVLVLGGGSAPGTGGEPMSLQELADVVLQRVAEGAKLKTAAKELAAAHAVPASEIYDAALARRRAEESG